MTAASIPHHRPEGRPAGPPAGACEALGGWQRLGARTPERPRARLLALFRSSWNLAYLGGVFERAVPPGPLRRFALETLEDSVRSFERGEDLIYSDPIAQRGDAKPAAGLWPELRRLNRAFYEYRMQFLRDKAALISGRTGDGQWDDDEAYHFRMFVADSLRPPGLERLNGTGPLYGIREDQTAAAEPRWPPGAMYASRPDRHPAGAPQALSSSGGGRAEAFSPRRGPSASGLEAARLSTDPAPLPTDPAVDPDDWGWDGGNPNRTPAQAIAEYWGEDHVESSALGAAEVGGETHLARYGQGPQWRENAGTRFMRYPEIPMWQNLSRGRDYDREIEETLGTGSRELGNQVRRWDLDRMRARRGEEYRRYGPRHGPTV
jgi:hypothetical protein